MIGLGKWSVYVNMMIYKGDLGVEISDDNGNYKVDFELPPKLAEKIKITTHDIVAEGNKISGKGDIDMGKGRKVKVAAEVVIDGDVMTGNLQIPLLKRTIPLENGHRVG